MNLTDSNFKNYLDAAMAGTNIEINHIKSGYIYNDINN